MNDYRRSSAQSVVEKASRFRVFHTDTALAVHNADAMILACWALHSYLRRKLAKIFTKHMRR
jgi:hypothetical protein